MEEKRSGDVLILMRSRGVLISRDLCVQFSWCSTEKTLEREKKDHDDTDLDMRGVLVIIRFR